MNRRIFALALAATAVACKEQPRRNADGSPALSYAAQDSLLKVKDSVISEKTRQLSEQSSIIGDAATSARLISEIDKDLANVRLKTGKKAEVTNVAETEANARRASSRRSRQRLACSSRASTRLKLACGRCVRTSSHTRRWIRSRSLVSPNTSGRSRT